LKTHFNWSSAKTILGYDNYGAPPFAIQTQRLT